MSDQSQPPANNWHQAIINGATKKLELNLTEQERRFITSRGGCIALETIMDMVRGDFGEYFDHLTAGWARPASRPIRAAPAMQTAGWEDVHPRGDKAQCQVSL